MDLKDMRYMHINLFFLVLTIQTQVCLLFGAQSCSTAYALDIALKHDRTTVMTNYYYCLTMSHTSNN